MQDLIARSVKRLGADACAFVTAEAAKALALHVSFFGASQPDELARHAAALELACEHIRAITGGALVDLHKVEALQQLQHRLR